MRKIGNQLRSLPDIPVLHQLLSQAMEKKGQKIQVNWRSAANLQFILDITCPLKGGSTQWQLYSERSGQRKLLCTYASHDILLIYKQITTAFAEETNSFSQSEQVKRAEQFSDGEMKENKDPKDTKEAPNLVISQISQITKVASAPPRETDAQIIKEIKEIKEEPQQSPQQIDNKLKKASDVERAMSAQKKPPAAIPQKKIPSSGKFDSLPVTELVRAITMDQATGHLTLKNRYETGEIFFRDGAPYMAHLGDLIGDDAVVELLTWKSGEFTFDALSTEKRRNVDATVQTLLDQAKRLGPIYQKLRKAGFSASCTFKPHDPNLTKAAFQEMVQPDCPLNLGFVARVYKSIHGEPSLAEISQRNEISLEQTLTALDHLVAAGVVDISVPSPANRKLKLVPKPIDGAAIQSVMMSLRREETGLFIYPAMLYFLEEEFFRSYRARGALSIFIIEMKEIVTIDGTTKKRVLPNEALVDAVSRIGQAKRHMDLLGHYNAFDYAMILPTTKSAGSKIFADRLYKKLTEKPLAGMAGKQVSIVFGAASIPEDFRDLAALLGGAELALQYAIENHLPTTIFAQIQALVK
jgi:hypothetical protein